MNQIIYNILNQLELLSISMTHPRKMVQKKGDKSENSSQKNHNKQHTEPTLFVSPPSESLSCPLHKELFKNPVIARCGHTFCRKCIEKYLSSKEECPIDKSPLQKEFLFPNLAVAGQIDDLLLHCKYGLKKKKKKGWIIDKDGCPEHIKIGQRKIHEDSCLYAPAICPYCEENTVLRRMNLEEHIKTCQSIPCPQKQAGCKFQGTKDEVDKHILTCGYENIKEYIHKNQEIIQALQQKLNEKEKENTGIQFQIESVNSKYETLLSHIEEKNTRLEAQVRFLTASIDETQKHMSDMQLELTQLRKAFPARYFDQGNSDAGENAPPSQFDVKCIGTFERHTGPVWCLAISHNVLVSGSSDMTLKVWDLSGATFKYKKTLEGHNGIVHTVVFLGRDIISGSDDKTIKVWNVDTGECTRTLTAHDNTVCAILIVGGYMFSGSYNHIKVWDTDNYKVVRNLTGHNHWVRALTTAGGFLYSGSYNAIKVWDLQTFEMKLNIPCHYGSIYSMVPYGRYLFCATYENTISVWDLETHQIVNELRGHRGAVYAVCICGGRLFSGSYDNTVKIWSLDTFKMVQTLVRHTSSIDAIVASNGYVFTGSADNSIKAWK